MKCYNDARMDIFQTKLIDGLPNEDGKRDLQSCNCLQACTVQRLHMKPKSVDQLTIGHRL